MNIAVFVTRKEGTTMDNNEKVAEINSSPTERAFEFNSYSDKLLYESIFNCGIYDYFTKEEIDSVLKNPIANYESAIKLSEFVYGKNGIVSNSIDYMVSLMTLDKVVTSQT